MVDYEFMDTKRVSDETSEQLFYEGLKYRLSKVAPYDVIILGDDAALLFAQKYREELFAEIPLVYEGVNNEQLAYEMSEDPLMLQDILRIIPHLLEISHIPRESIRMTIT